MADVEDSKSSVSDDVPVQVREGPPQYSNLSNMIELGEVKRWYSDQNLLHREDGPAVVYPNGSTKWYLNGKCHREDGPAVEYANGAKAWYLNNRLISVTKPPVNWNELVELAKIEQIMDS